MKFIVYLLMIAGSLGGYAVMLQSRLPPDYKIFPPERESEILNLVEGQGILLGLGIILLSLVVGFVVIDRINEDA